MNGEYPPDWSTPELGDFAKATGGSRFPPAAQGSKEGDYPFYKVSDMNLPGNERFMGVANHWITEATRKEIKARTFPAGSVIFPKIGAAVATNKKRLLTQESIIDNNVMAVVVSDPDLCAFSYLRFWFETIDLRDLSNSGALPSIPGHRVHTTRVPLPPLPEQKKIAHILSTVQRAIEVQERIIQTTTELKKALMHKLFTEGIHNEPHKQTEIGPVPESWEVTTVGDVTAVKGGKRLSKGDKLVEKDTGFPYIRVTDFNEFSVDVRRLLFLTEVAQRPISRYIINRDDVFISIAGSIGITGMIPPELDGANLTENAARLIANDSSQLHPRFLMYWLASHHCQAEIKAQTVKNAQPKLALARIKSIKVPLPSLDEQVEVAKALDLAGRKAEFARAKRDQLQDLFRTLLHELMTAKTRVNELTL